MTDLRFPVGKYGPQPFSEEQLKEWLNDIKYLPQLLERAVEQLDEYQLETAYREGGWNIRQVVHHVADSHMNALTRFKLGLTEDNPTIKPYLEAEWAKLADVQLPVNISITLLHALHARWHQLLVHITDEQWNRTLVHPEHQQTFTLWYMLGLYAWHGKHHVAHIVSLKERMGW